MFVPEYLVKSKYVKAKGKNIRALPLAADKNYPDIEVVAGV